MKRSALGSLVIGMMVVFAWSQERTYAQGIACGFHPALAGRPIAPPLPDQGKGFHQVRKICQAWGSPPPPVFFQPGVGNAVAFTNGPLGGGYIVYDPQFLNAVEGQFGPEASLGILAHEVGHIMTGIQFPNLPIQADEARADYFAGMTLGKLGLGRRGLQAVMVQLFMMGSARYPDGVSRAKIIELGYVHGGGHPLNN